MTDQGDQNDYWRRPAEPTGDPTTRQWPSQAVYTGPPESTPPTPDWRPQALMEISTPRDLPHQDHQSIDRDELTARSVTVGIGVLASAVLVILLMLVLIRLRY